MQQRLVAAVAERARDARAGDTAAQRSIEATDKLFSLLLLLVAALLGLQAIGLDIQSVLAISGFGGLALGLAGREILENLFNGARTPPTASLTRPAHHLAGDDNWKRISATMRARFAP